MAESHLGRPCQHSQTVSATFMGLLTHFSVFKCNQYHSNCLIKKKNVVSAFDMNKRSAFSQNCVQDVVSLLGSQEEGELGSAARHLPAFRKVCGQRPNGEELAGHQRHAAHSSISLLLWS